MKVTLLFCFVFLSPVLGAEDLPHELGKLSSESLSISSRIYGGNEAEEGQFPYMVMVFTRMTNGELRRCSGSRVAKDWVLTAANCILDGMTEKDIILVAGRANLELYILARKYIPFDSVIRDNSFDTEERRVKSFVRHPKYSQGQTHDNIALIELKTPFTDKVPLLKISPDKKDRHDNCTILGWGDTEAARDNGKLMYAKAISAVTPSFGCAHKDSGSFYCLDDVKKGICLRDFGGPLALKVADPRKLENCLKLRLDGYNKRNIGNHKAVPGAENVAKNVAKYFANSSPSVATDIFTECPSDRKISQCSERRKADIAEERNPTNGLITYVLLKRNRKSHVSYAVDHHRDPF
ncbi:hypothetical protein RUM44_009553 [Polyplax serrata]|uniref:Peptidase S1 domain-containing protein n=1 Tax=Polyplax serrata TaxID=468196 RepID=A0ABR1AT07_POLSC